MLAALDAMQKAESSAHLASDTAENSPVIYSLPGEGSDVSVDADDGSAEGR